MRGRQETVLFVLLCLRDLAVTSAAGAAFFARPRFRPAVFFFFVAAGAFAFAFVFALRAGFLAAAEASEDRDDDRVRGIFPRVTGSPTGFQRGLHTFEASNGRFCLRRRRRSLRET